MTTHIRVSGPQPAGGGPPRRCCWPLPRPGLGATGAARGETHAVQLGTCELTSYHPLRLAVETYALIPETGDHSGTGGDTGAMRDVQKRCGYEETAGTGAYTGATHKGTL